MAGGGLWGVLRVGRAVGDGDLPGGGGVEGGLQLLAWFVVAREVGVDHEEALAVVVGVDEAAGVPQEGVIGRGAVRQLTTGNSVRHTLEEIDDAGLERILGADDEEAFPLD